MDNHIEMSTPYPMQGPPYTDLYRLQVARDPIHGEDSAGLKHLAYFSLKEALCRMLLCDINKLDPVVEAGMAYSREPLLLATGNVEIASICAVRPGGQQWHHVSTPGVYLSSPLGIATLARITGMALSRPEGNDEDSMLLLAEYNKDFTRLSPVETFRQIIAQATGYLERNERLTNDMDHQLVYKGVDMSTSAAGSKDRRVHYVEQHYYNNLREPVCDLLRADPVLFDPYSEWPPGTPAKHHHVGYVISAKLPEVVASINVLDISDCPEGTPTAGIYLHAEPDIGTLESATGIDFSVASSYDPELPMLLLARFTYDNGYQLRPDPGISILNSQLALAQYTVAHTPKSPFVTRTHYEITGAEKGHPTNLRTAVDYYHYENLPAAILKLLHSDLALMNATDRVAGIANKIVQADVRDNLNQTWAHLRLHTGGHRRLTLLSLTLNMGLTQMAVQAGVIMDLTRMELLPFPPSIDGEQVMIPIAEYSPDGTMHTITQNFDILISLLEGQEARQYLPIADRIAAAMQIPPGQKKASYVIELEWVTEPESGDFRTIPFASRDEAHTFLLAIEPSLFKDEWPPSLYIETARLVATSTNIILAERFRLSQAADIMPAGCYLKYNTNEEGTALANSISGYERISMPGDPFACYRLIESPLPPSHHQMLRPRILPPFDPSRRLGK